MIEHYIHLYFKNKKKIIFIYSFETKWQVLETAQINGSYLIRFSIKKANIQTVILSRTCYDAVMLCIYGLSYDAVTTVKLFPHSLAEPNELLV